MKNSLESRLVERLLVAAAWLLVALFLLLPLLVVFSEALGDGWEVFMAALQQEDAMHALKLSLIIVAVVLPLNLLFGLALSWALGKFDFSGKQLLLSLVDLPFAVSPVVAGLVWVLIFGAGGLCYAWVRQLDVEIIFALPGMVLASLFITFPFVSRELIGVMQMQGNSREEAALSLGASSWQMFWRVSLPNLKWGLLYGALLCSARCLGEFGAVSVVSGHIRGQTNTLPLHIETLYNEYQFSAAFACCTLLSLSGVLTLLLKKYLQRHLGEGH